MHVFISADPIYLRDHAPVSVVSALEQGHQVTLQAIRAPMVENYTPNYRCLEGVTVIEADAPGSDAAAFTMPRLLALPSLIRQHGAIAMLDADTLVRRPLWTDHEIDLCVWPWGPTPEQRRSRARADGTTFEWCTEWMRITYAGGLFLRGEDGLRFATAIAEEAQKLINAGELWWGCDQVAAWRAFVREFPPANFRANQVFGFADGLRANEATVHPFPHERKEVGWRDTCEKYRGRQAAMIAGAL